MFTVLVWLSTSQYTLSTSQYTHSTSQYTLSTSQYTLSTSQYILSTSQYTLSTSQYTLSTSQYTLSTSQYILSTLFMDWTWMLPVFRFTWKVFLIFKNENLMSFSLSAWAISSSTSNHYEEHSRGWEGGRQTDRQTDRHESHDLLMRIREILLLAHVVVYEVTLVWCQQSLSSGFPSVWRGGGRCVWRGGEEGLGKILLNGSPSDGTTCGMVRRETFCWKWTFLVIWTWLCKIWYQVHKYCHSVVYEGSSDILRHHMGQKSHDNGNIQPIGSFLVF